MNPHRPITLLSVYRVSILCISSLCVATLAYAQPVSESREWTETYPVTADVAQLRISNIWGDVKVSKGTAGHIVVAVKELRTAPDQRRFDRSLELMDLKTEANNEGVTLIVGQNRNEWNRHQPCRGCRLEYQFDVRVPAGTDIDVSTVNDGEINVSGIQGILSANNVNGPIYVSGAQHCNSFSNINGVVDLSFAKSPEANCDIETINGDINLTMPSTAGIDLSLDHSNGRVISEFPVDTYSLPAQVEHIEKDGLNQYRIHQTAGLRIAGGGKTFTISSLNGDIRIQKSK